MKLLIVAAVLFIGLLAVAATNAAGRSAEREAPPERVEAAASPEPEPPAVTWRMFPVPLDERTQKYINSRCKAAGVDPAVVMSMIARESSFDPDKLGDNDGSYGLMQIHQVDHRDRCIRLEASNLFDPEQNVRVGIDFLGELLAEGKGYVWALTAYNGGQARADKLMAEGVTSDYAREVLDRSVWLDLEAWDVTEK